MGERMRDSDVDAEPSVEEILAEAERRQAASAESEEAQGGRDLSSLERNLVITSDRVIYWFARHWLALFNVLALLYVGVPFLAPVLMRFGVEGPARAIYTIYRPLCHQYPFRSWYLFGSKLMYSMQELSELVGPEALVAHGYIGDPTLGYKVALCQRDTAIYGAIFLGGMAFALVRHRLRPLPLWAYLLFGVVPIGLDGGIQILSYALPALFPSLSIPPLESTPWRRVVSGVMFGVATVWLAYPLLQSAASDVIDTLEERFEWGR